MNFNLHFSELHSDNSINYKNNLFENYIPKCYKVKRMLISFNCFSEYISDKCDWQVHLEYIQAKAWSRVHLLRSLKFVLDRKSLQTMYFTFIRPILEYADVVWDNCTQQQMND